MVCVAQSAERRFVVPEVAGSWPVAHPGDGVCWMDAALSARNEAGSIPAVSVGVVAKWDGFCLANRKSGVRFSPTPSRLLAQLEERHVDNVEGAGS